MSLVDSFFSKVSDKIDGFKDNLSANFDRKMNAEIFNNSLAVLKTELSELKRYKGAVNAVEKAMSKNPEKDIDLLPVGIEDIKLYQKLQENPCILKEIYCDGMLGGDRNSHRSGPSDVVNAFRYMQKHMGRVDFKHPDYIQEGLGIVAEIHPDREVLRTIKAMINMRTLLGSVGCKGQDKRNKMIDNMATLARKVPLEDKKELISEYRAKFLIGDFFKFGSPKNVAGFLANSFEGLGPEDAKEAVDDIAIMSELVRTNELIDELNYRCPELTKIIISRGKGPNDNDLHGRHYE
jgi:hypothetical protein